MATADMQSLLRGGQPDDQCLSRQRGGYKRPRATILQHAPRFVLSLPIGLGNPIDCPAVLLNEPRIPREFRQPYARQHAGPPQNDPVLTIGSALPSRWRSRPDAQKKVNGMQIKCRHHEFKLLGLGIGLDRQLVHRVLLDFDRIDASHPR